MINYLTSNLKTRTFICIRDDVNTPFRIGDKIPLKYGISIENDLEYYQFYSSDYGSFHCLVSQFNEYFIELPVYRQNLINQILS